VQYWLAIPKDSPPFEAEFQEGERLDLYLIRLGAAIVGRKYNGRCCEKLRKAATPSKMMRRAISRLPQNDYRSVSVSPMCWCVRPRCQENRGYEDWRVVCEVVEPFKAGSAATSESNITMARKPTPEGVVQWEKIVFLQRHHYEPEKRWDLRSAGKLDVAVHKRSGRELSDRTFSATQENPAGSEDKRFESLQASARSRWHPPTQSRLSDGRQRRHLINPVHDADTSKIMPRFSKSDCRSNRYLRIRVTAQAKSIPTLSSCAEVKIVLLAARSKISSVKCRVAAWRDAVLIQETIVLGRSTTRLNSRRIELRHVCGEILNAATHTTSERSD